MSDTAVTVTVTELELLVAPAETLVIGASGDSAVILEVGQTVEVTSQDVLLVDTGAPGNDAGGGTGGDPAGTAAALVAGHEAAEDPHPQYQTQTEADARYSLAGHTHDAATSAAPGFMSAADKAKLAGIAAGATANATDAQLRDRSTHTGAQAISTVTGLQAALDAKVDLESIGMAGGAASLGADGKVPTGQLPAIAVTDTFVVNTEAAMLALDAQRGDVAIRSDQARTYILAAEPATTLANWKEMLSPSGGVSTVFGRSGAVTAQAGDYSAAQISQDASNRFVSDAEKAAWNGKQAALGFTPVNKAGDTLSGPLVIERDSGLLFVSRTTTGKQFAIGNSWGTPGDGVAYLLNQANTDMVLAVNGAEVGRFRADTAFARWVVQGGVVSAGSAAQLISYDRTSSRAWALYGINDTFWLYNGAANVVAFGSAGGVYTNALKLGTWVGSASYTGLMRDDGAGSYMVMYGPDGPTYIGASAGNSVILRPNNNDTSAGITVASDAFVTTKPHYKQTANGTRNVIQPRIFVQSADPGAEAADGDLWIW